METHKDNARVTKSVWISWNFIKKNLCISKIIAWRFQNSQIDAVVGIRPVEHIGMESAIYPNHTIVPVPDNSVSDQIPQTHPTQYIPTRRCLPDLSLSAPHINSLNFNWLGSIRMLSTLLRTFDNRRQKLVLNAPFLNPLIIEVEKLICPRRDSQNASPLRPPPNAPAYPSLFLQNRPVDIRSTEILPAPLVACILWIGRSDIIAA